MRAAEQSLSAGGGVTPHDAAERCRRSGKNCPIPTRPEPAAPISCSGTDAAPPVRKSARRGNLHIPGNPPAVPVWLDCDVAAYLRVSDVRVVQRMRVRPRPGEFDLTKAVSARVGRYWRWDAASVRKVVEGNVRA